MRSLDVDECAAYLKVDRTTVLKLAAEGVLPGAKIGRSWVFPESLLVEYLTSEVRRQQTERRHGAAIDQTVAKRQRGQRLPSLLGTLPEP
jgi:excisionase family DNA binding protein